MTNIIMRFIKLPSLVLLEFILLSSAPAFSFNVFYDRGEFLRELQARSLSTSIEDFEDFEPLGGSVSTNFIEVDNFTVTANENQDPDKTTTIFFGVPNLPQFTTQLGTGTISSSNIGNPLVDRLYTFDFKREIVAFGTDIFDQETGTSTISNNGSVTNLNIPNTGNLNKKFIGFIDDIPFNQITLAQEQVTQMDAIFLDNIITDVPEPLTIMGSLVAVGFGFLLKRKQQL